MLLAIIIALIWLDRMTAIYSYTYLLITYLYHITPPTSTYNILSSTHLSHHQPLPLT